MSEPNVIVMGLGNLLWADEGFGIRLAERLYAHYHWPESVEIVDGGTQGLNLLGYVEQASHLLLLDAIDYGLAPGTLQTYAGDKVPSYLSAKKMSLHQNSFSEVLALADIRGHLPAHIALVGLQPVQLDDYGGSLESGPFGEIMALACRMRGIAGLVIDGGKVIVYRNEATGWVWPPYFKYDSSNLQAEATNLKSSGTRITPSTNCSA